MQGITRKRRLSGAVVEPVVELESIRSDRQRKRRFQCHQMEDINRVQQEILRDFPSSLLTCEQLRRFPFLQQGRRNCCTVVSINHLAFVLTGRYDEAWEHSYSELKRRVVVIDSLRTMYEFYGHKLVPSLKIVDLRQSSYADRVQQLQLTLQQQCAEHAKPVLVDAGAHTSMAIAYNADRREVLFVDTFGNTTADGGLWVVKLALLAALCKEFGFVDAQSML